MPIYTKTGDAGDTNLLGKSKLTKSETVFEVLGSIDELNANLGFLHKTRIKKIKEITISIQNDLFLIGALVAGRAKSNKDFDFLLTRVHEIESAIDQVEEKLPKLVNFILPGGTETSSRLHLCRVVCRRTERCLVHYYKTEKKVLGENAVLTYINRLSDLLFVLARYANNTSGVMDTIWKVNVK
jgi:cob(I)alamin adenosyltransferase